MSAKRPLPSLCTIASSYVSTHSSTYTAPLRSGQKGHSAGSHTLIGAPKPGQDSQANQGRSPHLINKPTSGRHIRPALSRPAQLDVRPRLAPSSVGSLFTTTLGEKRRAPASPPRIIDVTDVEQPVTALARTSKPARGTSRASFANVVVDEVRSAAPTPQQFEASLGSIAHTVSTRLPPAASGGISGGSGIIAALPPSPTLTGADEVAASHALSRCSWSKEEHAAGYRLPGHSLPPEAPVPPVPPRRAVSPPARPQASADAIAQPRSGDDESALGSAAPAPPLPKRRATSPPARPPSSLALGAGLALISAAAAQASTLKPYEGTPTVIRYGGFGGVPCDAKGRPELREREVLLPPPPGFVWPIFTHFAFYEHTGEFREAWAPPGSDNRACSVADRPSDLPPSERCWSFVGSVWDFVHAYPHTIRTQTSHVNCGDANWASWRMWPEKILDGRMLRSAEELLWILCIGDRAAAEQPHTAHEATVGPPTFVTNANQFGCADKTWCWWLRHLTPVAPTAIVPPAERWEELSRARGSPEQKSVRRADSPRPLVAAHVKTWLDPSNLPAVLDGGRPAAQPCPQYDAWRAGLHHNFAIFASGYAPVLSQLALLNASGAALVLVPIAPSGDGPCVLIPTRSDAAAFGELRDTSVTAREQAEKAAAFVSIGIETHHVCTTRNTRADTVVAVPWDRTPVEVATSRAQLDAARSRGDVAVWCSMGAIHGLPSHAHAAMAIHRVLALSGPVPRSDLRVGIWDKARPVVPRRAALKFSQAPADPLASAERVEFLDIERRRGLEMQRMLCAADKGDGVMVSMASDVRTAFDFAAELPWPKQGLPQFTDPALLFHPVPQPPLPLCIDWLHTLPPQRVPDGIASLPWTAIVRTWGRRLIVHEMNIATEYDDYCFVHGRPPTARGLRRPVNFALGRGAAHQVPFQDGVGSWNAFDVIWERHPDGLMYPLDFTPVNRRRWVVDAIKKFIGHTSDRELLSFLFEGVRWKLDAPRQIRVSRNLASYGTRAQAVAESMMKVVKKGIFKMVPIAPVDVKLDVDGESPLAMIPGWEVGCGGVDKPDKPNECRVVGDSSDPHNHRFEINGPHEAASLQAAASERPQVVSFNDLSGPKGGPKDGYEGPLPFPDPEPKPRPKHKYTAGATLSHYAWLAETYLCVHDDDIRHMFWQFFVAQEDIHLTIFRIIVLIAGVRWAVHIIATSMNMGARNASKIACRFAEEWLGSWRRQMDAYVEGWLPRQTSAFQAAYAQRLERLGFEQARPFWAGVYTDNFDMVYVGPDLAVAGIAIWKAMNAEANIWLAEGAAIVGTCNTWIGGRTVINGGFGCLTPQKRERALVACQAALRGELNRDQYESNNSFLSFANDILDFPPGTLRGIAAPLKIPGFGEDRVVLALGSTARTQYEAVADLIKHKALASFHAGVTDAGQEWSGDGAPTSSPITFFASDACTDPLPTKEQPHPRPHICGVVCGLFWRFPLTGEWLNRHITLTEACGPAIHKILTTSLFPGSVKVLTADATSATAVGVHTAKRDDLVALDRCLAKLQLDESDLWMLHWKGYGNGLADLGSRDDMAGMARLAAAFGVTLTEIAIVPGDDVHKFMADVLNATKPGHVEPSSVGLDVASACVAHDGAGGAGTFEAVDDEHEVIATPRGTCTGSGFTSVPASSEASPSSPVRPASGPPLDPPLPPRPSSHQASSSNAPMGFAAVDRTPSPDESPWLSPRRITRPPQRLRAAESDEEEECAGVLAHAPPGSPQPWTARAARTASTASIKHTLMADQSPYAISPGNPSRLGSLLHGVRAAKDSGIPDGTKSADENGFKWFREFGTDNDTRWMRPRIGDPAYRAMTEVYFTCLALIFICQNIAASARRKRRGFDQGQPTSAMQAVWGFQRVMRDCGRVVADNGQVATTLKGLCSAYKAIWGQDAFIREQVHTFTLAMLLTISTTLSEYSVPSWTLVLHCAWLVLVAYLASTGTRKDEFAQACEGDTFVMRDNFTWVDEDEHDLPSTPEVVASRKNGDYLKGRSAPSKCDRLNVEWGARDQWFRYDDSSRLNFAYQWQQWELRCPCPLEQRKAWPAFSPSGNSIPFSTSKAASLFHTLLVCAIGAADAAHRTIHSFRTTIASALGAARAKGRVDIIDSVIQGIVRWKSVDSLKMYEHMPKAQFADYVHIATTTDGGPMGREDMPTIGPADTVDALMTSIDVLTAGKKYGNPSPAAEPSSSSSKSVRKASKSAAAQSPNQVKPESASFEIQDGKMLLGHLNDSWGIVGVTLQVPNALWWPTDSVNSTACKVSAFVGAHAFSDGAKGASYIITEVETGLHYVARSSYLAAILDKADKDRVSKMGPPKKARL